MRKEGDKVGRLEKKLKDLQQKSQVTENQLQKKMIEVEGLKEKMKKKLAADEKFEIKSRQAFEKQFGRTPRHADDKVTSIIIV